MTTSAAKLYAKRAERSSDVEEKLTQLAKAIFHLANAIDDIERTVKKEARR